MVDIGMEDFGKVEQERVRSERNFLEIRYSRCRSALINIAFLERLYHCIALIFVKQELAVGCFHAVVDEKPAVGVLR